MYQDNFIQETSMELKNELIKDVNSYDEFTENRKMNLHALEMRLKNSDIEKNIEMLKKRKRILESVMLFIIALWFFLLFGLTNGYAQTEPEDISDMVFFVESAEINTSQHIANCNSDFCLNHPNSESAIITEQYCDTDNSCTEGCVRRWIDQSNYTPPGGFNPPEYTNGRNFGQDDAEKACYVSNCIGDKPCVRGGGAYGSFIQDKYLEIEGSDVINLPADFSIFLLAKPADQSATGDWFYFGQASHYARHRVSNNTMILNVGNNGSPDAIITTPNAIQLNQWQLIEIHRDLSNNITTYINGVESSVNGANTGSGNFKIGYLLSVFKTGTSNGIVSMHGDVAAFLVYNKKTNATENTNIRNYFNSNYLDATLHNQESLQQDNTIKIYPNPAKTVLTIANPNAKHIGNILIYDLLGRVLHKIEAVNTNETIINIDISKLESATYILGFEVDDSIKKVQQFIKY
nr:T9SS type A sorting domain-containing protein [uncultured Psychroserpens sp.]